MNTFEFICTYLKFLDTIDEELWMFAKFFGSHSKCESVQACNATASYTTDKSLLYLYEYLRDAKFNHNKDCIKFKKDNKLETTDCDSKKHFVCKTKCLPGKTKIL